MPANLHLPVKFIEILIFDKKFIFFCHAIKVNY